MNRDTPLVCQLMARQHLTQAEAGERLASLLRTDAEGWRFLAFSVASQTKGGACGASATARSSTCS